jgi:hypothetical protein
MPYSYASMVQRKMDRYYKRPRCPVCGRPGSGPHKKRIRGCEYVYFAHTLENPEIGKFYIKWCYIGPAATIEKAGDAAAYLEIIRVRQEPLGLADWKSHSQRFIRDQRRKNQ